MCIRDSIRIVVPGVREMTLKNPGSYTLYYEHRSTVDGDHYVTQSWLPPMEITIQDASSRALLTIQPATADAYNYTRYAGVPIIQFAISHPSRIVVNVINRSDQPQPFVIAVTNRPIHNPHRDLVPGVATVLLGCVIAARILLECIGR